uniref:Protein diaphanous homolog 1-like n=1 Tax=Camelus bactrianus TaxID=9837 RepID=A0A9W3G259_CAMBA|nr:protein diaphanous homolog 1-like [Camelus bactrianus]
MENSRLPAEGGRSAGRGQKDRDLLPGNTLPRPGVGGRGIPPHPPPSPPRNSHWARSTNVAPPFQQGEGLSTPQRGQRCARPSGKAKGGPIPLPAEERRPPRPFGYSPPEAGSKLRRRRVQAEQAERRAQLMQPNRPRVTVPGRRRRRRLR